MTGGAARTIDALLGQRAREWPDACFLRFGGEDLSFAAVDRRTTEIAHGLAAIGVQRGQLVPVLMPNCPDFVVTWFALCKLGAVAVLLNTAFRGPALVHALNLTGAEVAVVDAELVSSLNQVAGELVHLRRVVLRGDDAVALNQRFTFVPYASLESGDSSPLPGGHSEADPAMVLFTSGTTGRSKGCILSHRYGLRQAELMVESLELRSDDVLYCPFPLFHLDAAVLTVLPALILGTTAAVAARFSASGFWDDIRDARATVFDFMGATLTMLYKRPPRADDEENPARLAWGVPVPEFAEDFERRFGVQLVELYGSTDAGIPIYQPLHEPRRVGSCGRALSCYDVRLFDEHDIEVDSGQVGEIVVRPLEPSLMSDGYYGMPAETLASRRNLWFHSGDLARRDQDGYFYFVGRRADAIRRRGENISAFEVEEVIKLHPQVLDAAAYGVPSDLTEDDVMAALVVRTGQTIDLDDLIGFCRARMAAYMLPRYIEIVEELPRTPTEKVEKRLLIERGRTATTWDREAQGRH